MTYFISGHRDITPEEFEKFYVPAIVDVIDTCNDNYDDCEFVVGDCRGCDEMAANFIANYIKENTDDTECPPCILCIYHMFSEPRFRVGVAGQDGFYHVDMVDELNADLCEDDDPKCVDIINDIVSKTDCKVIVSSSWRTDSNLQSVFDKAGLKFQIYSTTPFRDHRGKEIQEWLNSQTEPYVYAILDDDREMLSCQNKFLVRTNGNVGITNEDANRVINILNRNDMWNDKLNSLIMESIKNHDAVRTTVLRAIKTEFSNYATAKNAKPLDNAAEVAIIKKLRDQRIDNAEQYRMVGRQDLYDNEMAESLILNEFLPEVPDDKVLALGLVEVCALQGCEDGPKIPKSKMGIIIKELKAMFPAADGKQIADLVKSCVV